ncbi:MAG: FISUMP domain-containing protein [Ferruginibacter sp.]
MLTNALKSTNGWNEDGNGTNTSGFFGLSGGIRNFDGAFHGIGSFCEWWTTTENPVAWYRLLALARGSNYKNFGFSVRCLRD